MGEVSRQAVVDFVEAFCATVLGDAGADDILKATRFDGDDAFDLIDAFGDQFKVNFEEYIWEFHHSDEAGLLGFGWPFKQPDQKVERIPISIDMLVEAARVGAWPLKYPPYVPDHRRLDRWNILIVIGLPMAAFILIGLIGR